MSMISAEQKLKQLLVTRISEDSNAERQQKDNVTFHQWFLKQFEVDALSCVTNSNAETEAISLEDFAVYVLNALRQHAEPHLRINDVEASRIPSPVHSINMVNVPTQQSNHVDVSASRQQLVDAMTSERINKMSMSSAHADDSIQPQLDYSILFSQDESDCHAQVQSTSMLSNNSTPVRRNCQSHSQQRSTDIQHRNSTANTSRDLSNRSSGKSSPAGLCLGDFIMLNTTPGSNRSQRNKKSTPVSGSPTNEHRKKRVTPTTIGQWSISENNRSSFGIDSSFGHENILRIAHTETEDRSKCTIIEASKTLKQNVGEINEELQVSEAPVIIIPEIIDASSTDEESPYKIPLDLTTVTNRHVIDTIALIYATLIDLNLVTNVLTEISFIMNLFNAPVSNVTSNSITTNINLKLNNNVSDENETLNLNALDNVINCIYFAMRVLERQKVTLTLLDVKSLGVLLQSDRLCELAPDLHTQLTSVHMQKQQMEVTQKSEISKIIRTSSADISCQNVHFQAEYDSRDHFTSNSEFGAFKTQRDLFYKALKLWEVKHLNPLWDFTKKLLPLIMDIFKLSENPVNMEHFAELFVAQLLISASDATSPEEIGLEIANVDQQKLSKLTQRLVAPSNFSVDYQFPRNQAFFRDFIIQSRSLAFLEQLKMNLYSRVIMLNNSTYEQLNLHSHNINDVADVDEHVTGSNHTCIRECGKQKLVVRPDVLASMLLLAKFLGFATALPFINNTATVFKCSMEKKQLWLRNQFEPHFDICRLLDDAIRDGKLLITMPWLVQYLVMLDNITLRVTHFVQVLQRLFELYTQIHNFQTPTNLTTSNFILRCCLGWLFEEKSSISEQYFDYRRSKISVPASMTVAHDVHQMNSYNLQVPQMCPLLESLLSVSCPFLAEFRVSIMPAKQLQLRHVSRTGRYRYVTLSSVSTMANVNTIESPTTELRPSLNVNIIRQHSIEKQAQHKLIEAFLHAQNASMRRLIDFVTERTYKSVVRDGQLHILLPSKTAADSRVNAIMSCQELEVATTVYNIYNTAAQTALQEWKVKMPQLINERSEKALNALLPTDTTPIIKHTYKQLIYRNAMQKVEQWTYVNMIKSQNFYCSNLQELSQKICKSNAKERIDATNSSDIVLVKDKPSISDILDDLQYWLHCTSLRPELCVKLCTPVIDLLQRILLASEGNTLPMAFYLMIYGALIQLIQQMIAQMPHLVSMELLELSCRVFLISPILEANKIRQIRYEDGNQSAEANSSSEELSPNPYKTLITIPFITTLGIRRDCYEKLTTMLVTLICQHVITVNFVNLLFIPIFKEDWNPQILNEISLMLRHVANVTGSVRSQIPYATDGMNKLVKKKDDNDDDKSRLFMEVLADFSHDTDEF